jgi:hypothetical protein
MGYHRQPGRVQLPSRRWRTSARDPVGLLDQCDAEANGLRGSRRRD